MNRFKELRKKKGYSQKTLADILFVNQTAVSQWERGLTTPTKDTLLKLCDIYSTTTDYILGRNITHDNKKGIKIPVLGRVPAGIPIEAVEDIIDWEEIPVEWIKNGEEYFGLQVNGDSMSPKYIEKDVVIIKKQSSCDSGQDAIVIVNGKDATLKKILLKNNGIVLQPLNHDYEPLFFTKKDIDNIPVSILGVVVELRRKII